MNYFNYKKIFFFTISANFVSCCPKKDDNLNRNFNVSNIEAAIDKKFVLEDGKTNGDIARLIYKLITEYKPEDDINCLIERLNEYSKNFEEGVNPFWIVVGPEKYEFYISDNFYELDILAGSVGLLITRSNTTANRLVMAYRLGKGLPDDDNNNDSGSGSGSGGGGFLGSGLGSS